MRPWQARARRRGTRHSALGTVALLLSSRWPPPLHRRACILHPASCSRRECGTKVIARRLGPLLRLRPSSSAALLFCGPPVLRPSCSVVLLELWSLLRPSCSVVSGPPRAVVRRLGLVLAPQARYLVITLALAQQARQELVRRFRRRLGPKRVHDAAFEDGQG